MQEENYLPDKDCQGEINNSAHEVSQYLDCDYGKGVYGRKSVEGYTLCSCGLILRVDDLKSWYVKYKGYYLGEIQIEVPKTDNIHNFFIYEKYLQFRNCYVKHKGIDSGQGPHNWGKQKQREIYQLN